MDEQEIDKTGEGTLNEYRFKDIKIGMKESFAVVITEELMNSFRDITGDINPMHQNDEFAIGGGI